ncbi:MAG: hypothetical protein JSR66_11740 [Proteobacteria bacterium]|nr:hypothetical protein [Pseudomonadota bacterium]
MLAKKSTTLVTILFGFAVAGNALAEVPADGSEPAPQTRQKMAALHEQMAACLRSDQAFAICQAQMVKSCKEQLGSECRMVGHGGDGPHRMRPMTPPPDK